MRFLLESTYLIPESTKWLLQRSFKPYHFEVVELDDIVNNLTKDNSVLNRRAHIWGNSYDKFKISTFKLDLTANDPIRLEKIDGKYRVLDGSHRLIALKNAGYDKAEVLVREG